MYRDRSNDSNYLDCDNCLANTGEAVRADMQCGWLPKSRRTDGGLHLMAHEPPAPAPCCPGYLMQHTGVQDAERHYLWMESGQIEMRCRSRGHEPTEILLDCLELLHGSYGEARRRHLEIINSRGGE